MAPVAPLGRKEAMKLVAAGKLPLYFGSPHQHVAIVGQDGVFRIRALVVDKAEADASFREAQAKGKSWLGEHYAALGKPTGEIYAESPTIDGLLATMETMHWPNDW